jgi:succinyl-CoA synthetase beta subunit
MWLSPAQLSSVLGACGLSPASAGGAGGERWGFEIAIVPHAAALRLTLRSDGGAAAVEVDAREPLGEAPVRELMARTGAADRLEAARGPLASLAAAFVDLELLSAAVELTVRQHAVELLRARALCDDNAAFRNERAAALVDGARPEAASRLKALGVDYVELDGPIALLSVGAGETMAAVDLLDEAGWPAACFVDVSGGFGIEAVTAAFREIMALPRVSAVLVNVFGGVTRVDRVGESITAALDAIGGPRWPIVVRLEGTEAERGRAVVAASGVRTEATFRGAIASVVALASGAAA